MTVPNDKRPDVEAIARSFRATGEFFSRLGEAEQVVRLVEAMQSPEPAEFRRFLDAVPKFPGKCLALCGAVRVIVEGEELREVQLCSLRPDLTVAEKLLAMKIYNKHFGSPRLVHEETREFIEVIQHEVVEVIWPSPYQDELRANGLVNCWKEKVSVPTWSIGPPSWQCADLCV